MIGVDVVDLDAFRAQLDLPGSRFADVFTPQERRVSQSKPSGDPAQHLAARFAAKEAFVKAWSGTFWGRAPKIRNLDLALIEVVQDAWGRPALRFHGELAPHMEGWMAWVSLSHDGNVATATVMLREPAEE